jgi:hypothetical protein
MTRTQRMLIGFGIGVALAMLITHKSHAHDTWRNGNAVDPITKNLCCGQNDCFVVPLEHVHYNSLGDALIDTDGDRIPANRIQPSPDGFAWRCRWGGETKCFFAPPMGY